MWASFTWAEVVVGLTHLDRGYRVILRDYTFESDWLSHDCRCGEYDAHEVSNMSMKLATYSYSYSNTYSKLLRSRPNLLTSSIMASEHCAWSYRSISQTVWPTEVTIGYKRSNTGYPITFYLNDLEHRFKRQNTCNRARIMRKQKIANPGHSLTWGQKCIFFECVINMCAVPYTIKYNALTASTEHSTITK